MKKMFLFISIILVTFGFSLNSNVISNSFAKNDTNNIEQLSNDENEIDIENDDGKLDATTTSDSATIHYKVTSNSNVSITELKYSIKDPDEKEIKGTAKNQNELEDDEQNDGDSSTHFYEGDITIRDLRPDTTYSSVVITGTDGKNPPDFYTSNKDANYTFETKTEDEFIFTNKVEVFPGTNDDGKNITGSATASYEIYNSPKKIAKIEWVNYANVPDHMEDFVLTSSEPPENESGNLNEGYNYNGSLTVDGLCSGSYDRTSLIIDEGKESKINSFTIENITKMGTVTATGLTKVDSTTEEVTYTINPALKNENDINDITVNPTKIVWINEDDSNELSSIEWNDDNIWNETGSISAKNLAPKEYNNTKLVVTDELGMTYEDAVDPFIITDEVKDETVINQAEVTSYPTPTSAVLSYEITTDPSIEKINQISWSNKGDEEEFKDVTKYNVPVKDGKASGTLTVKNLIGDTTYNETSFEVKIGRENTTEDNIIVKTPNGTTDGSVERTKLVIDEDTATISYKITPATDKSGYKYQSTSISWYFDDEKEARASEKPTSLTGDLKVKGLTGETTYTTRLVVETAPPIESLDSPPLKEDYESDDIPVIIDTLESLGNVAKTKDVSTKIDPENNSKATATVEYKITPSTQGSGEPILPNKISWINGDGTELVTNEHPPINEKEEITASDLKPGTPYENTYLKVEDGYESYQTQPFTFSTIGLPSQKGEVSGEVPDNEKHGTNATIYYEIKPPTDTTGADILKFEKIEWYYIDEYEDPQLLASEKPDTPTGGKMTTDKLETTNTSYKTYLVVSYIDAEGETITFDNKNDPIEFTSGNFKTKKIIMGSSILAIFVVILAIIGFFAYAWKKRRKVS